MCMLRFDGDKIVFDRIRFFLNLVILGSFLHYSVWSLCYQLLPQYSIVYLQTLHTFCRHNEALHVEFW